MLRMDQVHVLRHKVLVEGESIRKVARDMGFSRITVRKYLRVAEPRRIETGPRPRPVLERVRGRMDELLEEWRDRTTRKQRITGTRLHRQLREEGHEVGITLVRRYLREVRRREAEVYVPLVHRPGDSAQIDFFEVTVRVAEVRTKAWLFLFRLMFSGWDFAWIYPRADQVAFLDGHVRAFTALGGVPRRCVYDNASVAVKRVAGRERHLTDRLRALASFYLFEPCFTRVGTGHDKGGIESRGRSFRWQQLTPIPEGPSFAAISEALNDELRKTAGTRKDEAGRSVADRLDEERPHLLALPPGDFETRRLVPVSIGSRALAKVEGAYYSVPSTWARLEANAYIGVEDVRLVCRGAEEVHPRQPFGGRSVRYRHYLPELATKPQAVRQVAPELLEELGEPFGRLWQLLVDTHGEREAARVLARILGAVVDHGETAVREALDSSLTSERVDLLGLRRRERDLRAAGVVVPDALAHHHVEAACAADYDLLLVGAGHE
jgi:transposase